VATVRLIGAQARLVVPGAALLVAAIMAARSKTGVLSTAPLSGPFEYINADGAFYVQVAIAGLMLAAGAKAWPLRLLGGLAAGVFAVLPFAIRAVAAAWLVVALPAIALLMVTVVGARGPRAAVGLCGILFVASLAATIALGAAHAPGANSNVLERAAVNAVDEHRLFLWHDAFAIMQRHPATGVGARRYQVVSPIAAQDPDSRWAHNEFLQQGAEGGIAGLTLLALVFLWGFSRLWVVTSPDAITALSAAALAALGIHASIDYVMHFPAIPVLTAGLVATGMTEAATGRPGLGRERANGGTR
jgi:O-antigen ligase